VGLQDARKTPLRKFSKGMLQRAGIAQALMHDPELVVFDEPMGGLDPLGRKEVKEIILNLREEGKTVFFSSHILADVEDMCDRVAIISRGELQVCGSLSELLKDTCLGTEICLDLVGANPDFIKKIDSFENDGDAFSGRATLLVENDADINDKIREFLNAGANIYSVRPVYERLEDLFVRLTNRREETGEI